MRLLLGIAVGLTIATGAIHAFLAITFLEAGLTISAAQFGAMALPYLAAALLVSLDVRRRLWIRLGIAYVLLLLTVWAIAGDRSALAYAAKAIEVALLTALVALEVLPRLRPTMET